jgi:hypothetical protein
MEVGQLVLNKMTEEKGRIVRTSTLDNAVVYIVAVALDPRWGIAGTEALWRQSEIKGVGATVGVLQTRGGRSHQSRVEREVKAISSLPPKDQ